MQPPELIGTNDEPEFRGLVSCLSGDSFIHAKVELPDPCVAPIIMVVAGSEEKWFAVTGSNPKRKNEGLTPPALPLRASRTR